MQRSGTGRQELCMAWRLLWAASKGVALHGGTENLHSPLKARGTEIPWQVVWSHSSRAENGEIIKMEDSEHEMSHRLAKLRRSVQTHSGILDFEFCSSCQILGVSIMEQGQNPSCTHCRVTNMLWLSAALYRWLLSAPSMWIENTSTFLVLMKEWANCSHGLFSLSYFRKQDLAQISKGILTL